MGDLQGSRYEEGRHVEARAATGRIRPDVSDMYAVHGAFRDTLAAAPPGSAGCAPGDTERLALIANYYDNVLWFVDVHHEGEEALVFPVCASAAPMRDALMDEMVDQHQEVVQLLATPGPRWRPGPAAATRQGEARRRHCGRCDARWLPTSIEEERGLPLAPKTSRPRSGAQLPGHALSEYDGRQGLADPRG